jgi:hypothetical protein
MASALGRWVAKAFSPKSLKEIVTSQKGRGGFSM